MLSVSTASIQISSTLESNGVPIENTTITFTATSQSGDRTELGTGITDNNGQVVLMVSVPVGIYSIDATYGGSSTYEAASATTILDAEPVPVGMPTSIKFGVVKTNTSGQYVIQGTITSNHTPVVNVPLNISINGVQVETTKSDGNGNFTQAITLDPTVKNTVVVSFSGNDNYLSSSASVVLSPTPTQKQGIIGPLGYWSFPLLNFIIKRIG